MPDIFETIRNAEQAENEKKTKSPGYQSDLQNDYTGQDQWGNPIQDKNKRRPGGIGGVNVDGNIEGDSSQDGQKIAEAKFGRGAMAAAEERQIDDTSFSTQYAMGFIEDTKNSILRGVGNAFIKGSGDMIQAIGGVSGLDSTVGDGSMLSRWLQEKGDDFANKFKGYIPPELEPENLTWSSMANPKFWSTHIAEMIPQIAEFILLSKGGSFAARKAATSAIKKYGGKATKGVLGKASTSALGQTTMTGSGLVGALRTTEGLTSLGNTVVGAVGGGITSNILAGALNAADLINTLKEDKVKDANGNDVPLYTDEELSEMAGSSMRNNLAWIGVDIASFGMTYGGGYKHLKGLGKKLVGPKNLSFAQSTKIASSLHRIDTWPAVKALAKLSGKAIPEGFEETFQETFEEWAKQKAIADKTGFFSEDLLNANSFMDFYNSKANKSTKVLSFAAGALGGAGFNAVNVINDKADANLKLLDRTENFKKVTKNIDGNNPTKKELEMQDYFIDDTIANIVIDEKGKDVFDEFIAGAVERGNITDGTDGTKDEVSELQEKFEAYQDVASGAQNLNVKGIKALMYNNSLERVSLEKIEDAKKIHASNINILKNIGLTDRELSSAINDEVAKFQNIIKGLSYTVAKASENQKNLILGKKADPLELITEIDQFGNEILTAGLSDLKFEEYTQEDEFIKDGKLKTNAKDGRGKIVDKKALKESNKAINELNKEEVKSLKKSDLGEKGKSIFNKLVDGLTSKKEDEKAPAPEVEEAVELEDNLIDEETLVDIEKKNDVIIEPTEDGYVATPKKKGVTGKRQAKKAQSEIDDILKKKQ
jgi:hypothetical protein